MTTYTIKQFGTGGLLDEKAVTVADDNNSMHAIGEAVVEWLSGKPLAAGDRITIDEAE